MECIYPVYRLVDVNLHSSSNLKLVMHTLIIQNTMTSLLYTLLGFKQTHIVNGQVVASPLKQNGNVQVVVMTSALIRGARLLLTLHMVISTSLLEILQGLVVILQAPVRLVY